MGLIYDNYYKTETFSFFLLIPEFTGDPFVSCTPNPCGSGATCQPGSDRSGSDRPVCTCPSGFRGDPLVSCTRGKFTVCKFPCYVFCF